jgi:hypothetical protein
LLAGFVLASQFFHESRNIFFADAVRQSASSVLSDTVGPANCCSGVETAIDSR